MITFTWILTLILIAFVIWVLFKILGLVLGAVGLPSPWGELLKWVLILIVVIWAAGYLGVTQPIIR